jgi:hypothetical protein
MAGIGHTFDDADWAFTFAGGNNGDIDDLAVTAPLQLDRGPYGHLLAALGQDHPGLGGKDKGQKKNGQQKLLDESFHKFS